MGLLPAFGLLWTVYLFSVTNSLCPYTGLSMMYMPDYQNCSKYYICVLGFTVVLECGPGAVWQQEFKVCCLRGSWLDTCTNRIQSPVTAPSILVYGSEICYSRAPSKVAHATNCARYYDCSQGSRIREMSEPFERECPYNYLFSSTTNECKDYRKVDCGGKYIPKNPCDYGMNKCVGNHCIPCNMRFPDCNDLSDGRHAWKGKIPSPDFVECEGGRIVGNGTCPQRFGRKYIFDDVSGQCVSTT